MSTASVSGSVRPPSTNNHAHRTQSATQPTPEDAQAMRDALASARERSGREGTPAPVIRQQPKSELAGQPKAAPPKTMPGKQEEARVAFGHALRQQQTPGRDPLSADREAARDSGHHSDAVGIGQQQAGPPPVVVTAPPLPPSHVDAAAFAQLMTRLWNRESAKGTKEVHVEFGDSTWPATGARLVRNAAGTLDVQLYTADRGKTDQNLDELRERFSDYGIEVGALEVSQS